MICRRTCIGSVTTFAIVLFCSVTQLVAQEAATQPTEQTNERVAITARVLEVKGDCQHAALDSDEWTACAVGDEYPELTQIRTGIRSSLKLQIGDDDTYTAVVIDPATKTVLSEASRTPETKRVRIGVGYGRIRAGVAEGGLKSDFTVDSPVATLSKRGTWDFGLFFERGTQRFEVFLLDHGLVEAFDKVREVRREVLPGQIVTQVMRRWMDEVQMRRSVPVPDILGQGDVEVAFNQMRYDGLRVLGPESGRAVLIDLSEAGARTAFSNLLDSSLPQLGVSSSSGIRNRPEGWFGTGRLDELIPVIIETNNPLVQKGRAQAGRYVFRRAVLEAWRGQYKK